MITGIGSLPFKDPAEAVRSVFEFCPEFPYLPELPQVNENEWMLNRLLREPGESYAALPAFLKTLGGAAPKAIKFQLCSPQTFLSYSEIKLSSGDLLKRYDLHLAFLAEQLKSASCPTYCVLDGPSVGCRQSEELVWENQLLEEVFERARKFDFKVGLHSCSFVGDVIDSLSALKIKDLDALFIDCASPEGLSTFTDSKWVSESRGLLGFGIVPTAIDENYDLAGIKVALKETPQELLARAVFTPACGFALRNAADVTWAFDALASLADF